jgi:hypothetical protein
MRILSGMNTADINDFSGPGEDYKIAGPEDQLEEIIILAYETALDAGLEARTSSCSCGNLGGKRTASTCRSDRVIDLRAR